MFPYQIKIKMGDGNQKFPAPPKIKKIFDR